jgi:3-oxoacyl-ACP reductase-like protein
MVAITEDSIVSGEFTNKVAVVTGGSRGIGREIAADLAGAGAQTRESAPHSGHCDRGRWGLNVGYY